MEKTNVKNAWTSKVLSALLLMFTAVMFVACGSANSIKGHSYFTGNSSQGVKIYFSPSGTAQITYYENGTPTTYIHHTYSINGNLVEIYYDYSDYWKIEYQGKLLLYFTYDPETDILIYDDGTVFNRLQ